MTTMDAGARRAAHKLSMHGNSKDAWKRYGSSGFADITLKSVATSITCSICSRRSGSRRCRSSNPRGTQIAKHLWNRYDRTRFAIAGVRPIPNVMPGTPRLPSLCDRGRSRPRSRALKRDAAHGRVAEAQCRRRHSLLWHAPPAILREAIWFAAQDLPNATKASQAMLSLPMYPRMTLENVDAVCSVLESLLKTSS